MERLEGRKEAMDKGVRRDWDGIKGRVKDGRWERTGDGKGRATAERTGDCVDSKLAGERMLGE